MEIQDIKLGGKGVARIYHGDSVVFPRPVTKGLVLWYDFMGRTNQDAKRGIAEDLSGNGNHGTLTNFAYTLGSGYEALEDYVDENLIKDSKFMDHVMGLNIIYLYRDLKMSETYTIQGGYEVVEGETPVRILFYSNSTGDDRFYIPTNGERSGSFEHTFVVGPGWTKDLTLYAGGGSAESRITHMIFRDMKMEVGSTATSWNPSPADPEYKKQTNGRHLAFDGADDIVVVASGPSLQITGQISLEVTLKTGDSVNGYMRLVDKTYTAYSLVLWNTGKIGLNIGGMTNGNNKFSSTTLLPNTEYHIVATFDTVAHRWCIYINGIKDAEGVDSGVINTSTRVLQIGRDGAQAFKGAMCSSRIYNRALNEAEVQHNYLMEKERWNL